MHIQPTLATRVSHVEISEPIRPKCVTSEAKPEVIADVLDFSQEAIKIHEAQSYDPPRPRVKKPKKV